MTIVAYISPETSEYPVTEDGIRSRYPDHAFPRPMKPEDVAGLGFAPVYSVAPVFDSTTQAPVEVAPVYSGGEWRQEWTTRPLTPAELGQRKALLISTFQVKIQERLDAFARTRNYDGILSACTYATDANPVFAAEGQCCVNARSATWATCYALLAEVEVGSRVINDWATLEALLPVLTWPA